MKGLARPYRARRWWDAYPDNVTASKPPNVNVASARQQLWVASSSATSGRGRAARRSFCKFCAPKSMIGAKNEEPRVVVRAHSIPVGIDVRPTEEVTRQDRSGR
jgi:hypothetical protein